MYEARLAKDFDRRRILKEVSGELVSRFFSDASASGSSALDRDNTRRERLENSHSLSRVDLVFNKSRSAMAALRRPLLNHSNLT